MSDPVIVCKEVEEIVHNEDELSILRLGPKFCEFTNLDEVLFKIEVDPMILKYKWETIWEGKKEKVEGNIMGAPSILARRILLKMNLRIWKVRWRMN